MNKSDIFLNYLTQGKIFENSLNSKVKKNFETSSGNILEIEVKPKDISIRDEENECIVRAFITDDNFIQAIVRTNIHIDTHETEIKHPDLNASKLLKREIKYLKNLNKDIEGFRAKWITDSLYATNTTQFIENLAKNNLTLDDVNNINKDDPSWDLIQQAAFDTWSGKIALKENFTSIKRIIVERYSLNDLDIIVEFVSMPTEKKARTNVFKRIKKLFN